MILTRAHLSAVSVMLAAPAVKVPAGLRRQLGAHRTVRLDGGKKPAKEQLLFSFGENETSKGTFTLDAEGAALVMAQYRDQGNDLPIDYEHEIAIAAEDPEFKGGALKTAGYFKLELRADGIYAVDIDWTPEALQKLADGELKYTSPWFFTDKDNRIVGIGNFSLVARPATKNQRPIAASIVDHRTVALSSALTFDQIREALYRALRVAFPNAYASLSDIYDDAAISEVDGKLLRIPYALEGADALLDVASAEPVIRTYTPAPAAPAANEETSMKNLLAALSLATSLSEDAAVSHVLSEKATRAAQDGELLSITGTKNRAEAMGVILAWKQSGEQVARLTGELAKRDGDIRDREVSELLAQGKREGKISPAMEPMFLEQGKKDPAFLRSFIATAPKIMPTESQAPSGTGGSGAPVVVTLSAEDKQVAKMMNVSEEDFAKTKARITAQRAG